MAKTIKLNILMPFLADELVAGLKKLGERALANSVSNIEIVGRCNCDNQGCGAFYTLEEHQWSGQDLRQLVPAIKGLYSIDVLGDQIVFIDFMGRMDIRDRLIAIYP